MSFDANAIRASKSVSSFVGQYVKLTMSGPEWKGRCPFHNEKTASFTVYADDSRYKCFGCGAAGDVIRFVMDHLGVGFPEACEILGGERQAPDAPRYEPPASDARTVYDDLVAGASQVAPVAGQPLRLWNPKTGRWASFVPSMVFPYRASDAALLGCVVRIDRDDGKETPQVRYALGVGPAKEDGWVRWPFDRPRPLYGLERLAADPSRQVLVVEGEKCADAGQRLLGLTTVSWPGGGQGWKYVDWQPLAGRSVALWPDADRKIAKTAAQAAKAGVAQGEMLPYLQQPGPATMDGIAELLAALDCKVRVIDVGLDEARTDGWDVADAEADGWTADQAFDWLAERVNDWAPQQKAPAEVDGHQQDRGTLDAPTVTDEPPMPVYEGPDGEPEAVPPQPADDTAPFRILGHSKGTYYYFPRGPQQIVELTASSHTVFNLIRLAPLDYWEHEFPKQKKTREKFDLSAAVNALINRAHAVGPYDTAYVRGRGAWEDNGRVMVHTGRTVFVDGVKTRPQDVKSRYLYEAGPDLNISVGEAASTKEANRLVEICRRLTWERNLSGDLLAGWCVIAPICGAVNWRPHIWVTGMAQSGKSTVIKQIVRRVVGEFGLYADSKTTEAGLRQSVGIDARPVILDEVEGEDVHAVARVQNILDMARGSSSGATVTKGTTAGRAITYQLRSCFCFASINVSISQSADESRMSRLVLRQNKSKGSEQHYRDLTRDINEWFSKDFSARMFARSIQYLDVLRKNIGHFHLAAQRLFRSARDADQIGTLLAGLYLCHSTKEIDAEAAEMWMSEREWGDHVAIDPDTDDKRLLERLMTRQVKFVNGRVEEMNLGEAILYASSKLPGNEYEVRLKQYGIKLDNDHIIIANKASPIDKLLEGTPWAKDWASKLKILADDKLTDTTYFCPGIKTRGIRLPLSLLRE